MSEQQPEGDPGRQPTEEELLAAYEEQVKQLRIEDVLVQTLVSLLNLGGRKAGLAPGSEDERDPGQVQLAIEGARALLPLVEPALGPDANQVRQALSQLQMAYAKISGAPGGGEPPAGGGGEAPGRVTTAAVGGDRARAAERAAVGPRPVARRRVRQPSAIGFRPLCGRAALLRAPRPPKSRLHAAGGRAESDCGGIFLE